MLVDFHGIPGTRTRGVVSLAISPLKTGDSSAWPLFKCNLTAPNRHIPPGDTGVMARMQGTLRDHRISMGSVMIGLGPIASDSMNLYESPILILGRVFHEIGIHPGSWYLCYLVRYHSRLHLQGKTHPLSPPTFSSP